MSSSPAAKAVSSRDNPLLVRLRKLAADPAGYRKAGQLWIEGDHLCSAFLKRGGRPGQALITEAGWQRPDLRELAQTAAALTVVPEVLMAGVSSLESAPSIGFLVDWPGAGQLLPDAPTVVLDRLQDAGNVGAVLRSAAAFGFRQCVALKGTAALWSPKVLRAGMGAHFALNLVELADESTLESLCVPLLGTSSHATLVLHKATLPWPCAWVMGHEGQGVSPRLAARCVMSLRIPQPGGEESLNVAAAAAVCLYESARQRA
jgi:RNA methyltransferase, TrmH family